LPDDLETVCWKEGQPPGDLRGIQPILQGRHLWYVRDLVRFAVTHCSYLLSRELTTISGRQGASVAVTPCFFVLWLCVLYSWLLSHQSQGATGGNLVDMGGVSLGRTELLKLHPVISSGQEKSRSLLIWNSSERGGAGATHVGPFPQQWPFARYLMLWADTARATGSCKLCFLAHMNLLTETVPNILSPCAQFRLENMLLHCLAAYACMVDW
jgi:hypothetical protein